MNTKIVKHVVVNLIMLAAFCRAHGQTTTFNAVMNGDPSSHQADDYRFFSQLAPTSWANYIAGPSGIGGSYGEYLTGLNWGSQNEDGTNFLRDAVNNNFDLAYMYSDGTVDPNEVDYAAQHGCAVITKYGWANAIQYLDYRTPGSGLANGIQAMGPTPAMTVSCGSQTTTTPINEYGPQLEFIDNDFDDQQSFVFSETAARYATLKAANPTWNVFDVRQALRQTCTGYSQGWNENIGYGFPQVILTGNRDGITSQPTLPTSASELDPGPPIQPYAAYLPGGSQVYFTWYNFHQTAFASTVIEANGNVIYNGDGTSFVWTPNISGDIIITFYTKLVDGRMSRTEIYTTIPISAVANPVSASTYRNTPTDINVLASDSSGEPGVPIHLSSITSVSANIGTVTINPDNQTVHFVPTESFLGTAEFNYTMTDGVRYYSNTVTVNVLPNPLDQPPVITAGGGAQISIYQNTTVSIPVTVSDTYTLPDDLAGTLASSSPSIICNLVGSGANRVVQIQGYGPVNGGAVTLTFKDDDQQSSSVTFQVTVLTIPSSSTLPILSDPVYSGGGSAAAFTFNVSGNNGDIWNVYSSSDLNNWTPMGTVTLNNGPVSYIDNGVAGINCRFYKLSNGNECSRVVGFYHVTAGAGYTSIANQLDISPDDNPSDNTLLAVFGNSLPSGTIFQDANLVQYAWNGSSWLTSTTFSPGQGGFIQNNGGTPFTMTFVGYVREGNLTVASPSVTATLISSVVPLSGGIQSGLGYQPVSGPNGGDQLHIWNGTGFRTLYYFNSSDASTFNEDPPGADPAGWYDTGGDLYPEPTISIGESFGFKPAESGENWQQNYLACNDEAWTGAGPAQLSSVQATGSTFTFNVSGIGNSAWTVYTSTDLNSWTQVGTVNLVNGSASFTDSGVSGVNCRFYKVTDGEVCSRVVGFYRIIAGSGYTIVANQLDVSPDDSPSDNTLSAVFGSSLPLGTQFQDANQLTYTWNGSAWSGSTTLSPGQGGFIQNNSGSAVTLTFAGYVREGNLFTWLSPSGSVSMVSSMMPVAGGIQSGLGYQPTSGPNGGDKFAIWNGTGMATYYYFNSADATAFNGDPPGTDPAGWYDKDGDLYSEPTMTIGEPFYFWPYKSGEYWQQNFSPCNGEVVPSLAPAQSSPAQIATGSFTVNITGPQDSSWGVFSSVDLENWTQVGNVTLVGGTAAYTDNTVSGVGCRFYKLSDGNGFSRIVGFYKITAIPGPTSTSPGYTPAPNQLDVSLDDDPHKNTLSAVFANNLPAGTVFQDANQVTYTWNGDSWSSSTTISPGQGGWIQNNSGTPIPIAFVGYVREGSTTTILGTGSTSLVSSTLPIAGGIQSGLGYQPTSGPNGGDQFAIWNGTGFARRYYFNSNDASVWNGDPPGTDPAGWYDNGGDLYSEPFLPIGWQIGIEPYVPNEYWTQTYFPGQ